MNKTVFIKAKARKSAAFTIAEILTVVSIMMVLAGLSSPLITYCFRSSYNSRAQSEIKAIENALECYKAEYGGYPPLDTSAVIEPKIHVDFVANENAVITNGVWTNSRFIYEALTGGPRPLIKFKPSQLIVTNLNGVVYHLIKDPYGKPYGYNPINPRRNAGGFDLWSCGSDGKSEYLNSQTADDINNWK